MLKLSYAARARLWADVIYDGGGHVFVATEQALPVGSRTPLELSAPDLTAPLVVDAEVVALKPSDGPNPAGMYLVLDDVAIARCLEAIGTERDAARVAGRAEVRADCALPVAVLQPTPMQAVARSLSLHGLTLEAPRPLAERVDLTLRVTLPNKQEIELTAQVVWARQELNLSGLKFRQVDGEVSAQLHTAVLALQPAPVPAVEPLCVLVADDDPSILEFATRVVAKAGFRVVRAERGDDALELARRERPALCLLDVLMPGLDGLEVCRAIRADAALAKTPLVLLSALGEGPLATAARSVGADAWLTKPMRLDALRAVMASLLSGSK
jgi:CheY-like chemotaxis protein